MGSTSARILHLVAECITNSSVWCYSPSWYPSSAYSPDKATGLRSMNEMKAILDALAP